MVTMKNKVLPALILSIAVMAGVMTSITDAYAQTNTERLMTVADTTEDTNSMVATIMSMLEDIQDTLDGIVSALAGLASGQSTIMQSQDALSNSVDSIATSQGNLGAGQDALESKIGEVSMMVSSVEMALSEKIGALESSITELKMMDTGDDDNLEAAVIELNQLIQSSHTGTDDRIDALEQALSERLNAIETRLGGVTEDLTAVSEQVQTQVPIEASAAQKGTAKTTLTLADYASDIDRFVYNSDDEIDHNLKFECEETVYIDSIVADPTDAVDATAGSQLSVYHAVTNSTDAPIGYTIDEANPPNPFNLTQLPAGLSPKSTVNIPDIQLTSIVLVGEHRTVPPVPKPITLEAGDSFTIATSMANQLVVTPTDPPTDVEYVFYDHATESDLRTLLDSKAKIDGDETDGNVGAALTAAGVVFASADGDIRSDLQKADNKRLSSLADNVEILDISVNWFSAVSDPKCTFTPIGEETVDYPNQDNKLNLFTTIENIEVNASVTCNGQDTRIESIDDVRIGGSISAENTGVGFLTLTADNESIRINLNEDRASFTLADDDADFPLEFSDTLEISGVIVPDATPGSVVIEITYDTAAGNTCTQQ